RHDRGDPRGRPRDLRQAPHRARPLRPPRRGGAHHAEPLPARRFLHHRRRHPGGRRPDGPQRLTGDTPMPSPILAPVIALVLWSLVMWAWLYATRIPAVNRLKVPLDPNAAKSEFDAALPPNVRWKADNYTHL